MVKKSWIKKQCVDMKMYGWDFSFVAPNNIFSYVSVNAGHDKLLSIAVTRTVVLMLSNWYGMTWNGVLMLYRDQKLTLCDLANRLCVFFPRVPERTIATTTLRSLKWQTTDSTNQRPSNPPCGKRRVSTNGNLGIDARVCFAAKKISRENRPTLV